MKKDLMKIIKYIFIGAILVAVCVLPALYAWINIYANKDPYSNTSNIPVAVSSYDKGTYLDGKHINSAEDVMDNLENNKSLDFKIIKSPDNAKEGVKSGKYYAAIIFEDGFTDNMYNMDKSLDNDKAKVTYYTNTKKNSVASKITDTAAENVLDSINNKYIETIFSTFFNDAKDLNDEFKDKDAVNTAVKELTKLRNNLNDYDKTVKLFLDSSSSLNKSISNTKKDFNSDKVNGKKNIDNAKENIEDARSAIKSISKTIDENISNLKKDIDSLDKSINELKSATDENTKQKIREEINKTVDRIIIVLERLLNIIPEDTSSNVAKTLREVLTTMIKTVKDIKKTGNDIDTLSKDIETLKTLNNNTLVPNFKTLMSEFDNTLELTKPIIESSKNMINDIDPVLDASLKATNSMDTSMIRLEKILSSSVERLDELLAKIKNAKVDDKAKILIDFLNGDPNSYSKFFTSLVDVKTKKIYKADNYGTAMTPFYSVLAIWVGGVILVSVLSLDSKKKKFEGKSEGYIFFKKFIPFFVLGQIQAAIIVLGDILLLGIDPVHPLLMFISAAAASLAFTMFIYSFAISFGDIGKGIVVVIMVLQISGSSGSFPIEILPQIYDQIYTFFPFPYAINAMREALCGIYQYDFIIYIMQLSVFFIAGIIIGLVIRRPFTNINNFVTEKLEETEVL